MTEATQQTPQRPGQMTAVMRAVAASGPKVLRIGVVQNGRVIEERIIKERGDVTIGPSEKSMFVLSANEIQRSHRLFVLQGEGYTLSFTDAMTGRVALPTGVSDLEQLKGHARKADDGSYQIRLTEDSRGKVLVGETTFLFQFVAPPPVQPRPQLPVAVTRGVALHATRDGRREFLHKVGDAAAARRQAQGHTIQIAAIGVANGAVAGRLGFNDHVVAGPHDVHPDF